ncbi:MAG: methyltransferase [Acidobacteriota bacterium]
MSKQAPSQLVSEVPLEVQFLQMLSGYWVSQSLYVAARLGIADLLANGSRAVEDLAQASNSHTENLYRLLRALAGVGVFVEEENRKFGLTPLAQFLQTGVNTQRAMAIHIGETPSWNAWGDLLHTIQTGETAFAHVNGQEVFPYYAEHPESQEPFNQAMTNYSEVVKAAVLQAYDFSGFKKIVDVGGGHGSMLTAILEKHTEMQGVVFDLPPVVEGAKKRIEEAHLTNRCEAIGGDFFEAVPAGGDVYTLKTIIHDWDEQRAIKILKNLHRAMKDDGKLLLIETVIPEGNEPSFSKLCDIHMMVMTGGRERSESEYAKLFAKAGFKLTRVVSGEFLISIIEAEKVK